MGSAARIGTDSSTSVLDLNCKTHDLDNLYVADSSFFPSSSAVNPSLTTMANALRIGDHLLHRFGVHETSSHFEALSLSPSPE
jgi:choline dehydrogenase-like flavoprotein